MDEIREIHVVGAAILRWHQCLVARRAAHVSSPGRWEFPGGKVEAHESPREALIREIFEELGIDIGVDSFLGRGTCLAGGRRILLDVYSARLLRGRPQLRDHDAIRWVRADQIRALDWAEADIPILPALEQLLRTAASG